MTLFNIKWSQNCFPFCSETHSQLWKKHWSQHETHNTKSLFTLTFKLAVYRSAEDQTSQLMFSHSSKSIKLAFLFCHVELQPLFSDTFVKLWFTENSQKISKSSPWKEKDFLLSSLSFFLHNHVVSCDYPVSLNHSPSSLFSSILPEASSTHRCIGVSCCDCSRCRLAGILWSSVLWRRAGSHCCRSRSHVCRQNNQQQAHLRSQAQWVHRTTQLQAVTGSLSPNIFLTLTFFGGLEKNKWTYDPFVAH